MRTLRLGRQSTPAAFQAVGANNFFHHANDEALLKAAVLAPVTAAFVNWAVLISQANIFSVFLHCALRKQEKGGILMDKITNECAQYPTHTYDVVFF